jgi:hypothetical protein
MAKRKSKAPPTPPAKFPAPEAPRHECGDWIVNVRPGYTPFEVKTVEGPPRATVKMDEADLRELGYRGLYYKKVI